MSDSIRVPNYNGGAEPLYLYRGSSDGALTQDALHQSGRLRVDNDVVTEYVIGEKGTANGLDITTGNYYNVTWDTFPILDEFDNVEMRIKGAKIPITVTIVDDLGGEDEHDMGSTTSIMLNPPPGRRYVSASIKRRL